MEDTAPSTYDYGTAAKSQDPVLHVLKHARQRIEENWAWDAYVDDERDEHGNLVNKGAVCAVGGLLAAAGLDEAHTNMLCDSVAEVDGDLDETYQRRLQVVFEQKLVAEVREAYRLVNEACVDLFPTTAVYGHWTCPLEALNQDRLHTDSKRGSSGEVRRSAVLHVYDEAIKRRQGHSE